MKTQKTKQEEKKVEKPEEIVIKVTRSGEGVEMSIGINGFSPEDFRKVMFRVITKFTEQYESGRLKFKENE